MLNSLLQNDPFFLIRNKELRKRQCFTFQAFFEGWLQCKTEKLKKTFFGEVFDVNHNITRHSEIASTRELQVLFEASGVVFLEVFTKVKDSYNLPGFKVWEKCLMTKFNSNHIFVSCIYFEEAIPESCLLSNFVSLKIYAGSSLSSSFVLQNTWIGINTPHPRS